jgi:sugar lactone lactonase YvrE
MIVSSWRHHWLYASVLVTAIAGTIHAQSMLTYAGGGPIGDGFPATSVTIPQPRGVAIDSAGNVYLTDPSRQRVRRVDAQSGLITTIAGGGSSTKDIDVATELELLSPGTLSFDRSGRLLIVEEIGGKIRRLDFSNGIVTTVAGNGRFNRNAPGDGGPATAASFAQPAAVAADTANNLYIADFFGNRVRKVDAVTGIITTIAGTGNSSASGDGGPATQASLAGPSGLALDAAGNLYILDIDNGTAPTFGRVRKISASTGIITTIVGGGSTSPQDGILATSASLPLNNFNRGGLAVDPSGVVYISVLCCAADKVWRYDPTTGTISLYAGSGSGGSLNSGINARSALFGAGALALTPGGNLLLTDYLYHRLLSVSGSTRILTNLAAGGPIGDGGQATSGFLFFPRSVVLDASGNLYIADELSNRVRKVAADTGVISTFAGTGIAAFGPNLDGVPATSSRLFAPFEVAIDNAGNVYISDFTCSVRKVFATTGIITTVAGSANGRCGFSGDGGPAAQALISEPQGIAVDSAGNLYIADIFNNRIRKVSSNGIITTLAGNGSIGFGGDNGPATNALLNRPIDVALDAAGNIYVADHFNNRVRKIDPAGMITTVAGNGNRRSGTANGQRAVDLGIGIVDGVAVDNSGNLYLNADFEVDKVDMTKGTITNVIGFGTVAFRGDNGPARKAAFKPGGQLTVSRNGDIFLADPENHRVRAALACTSVEAPQITGPDDSAATGATPPVLTWNAARGAFRYDVYLDTENPPQSIVAADLTAGFYARSLSYVTSNLVAAARYFWKVVAKGDPFCSPISTNSSPVRSFTTAASCSAPAAPDLLSPPDSATVSSAPDLTWQAVQGAFTYDLYLGTSNPPALVSSTTETHFTPASTVAGTTYFWQVVAHAACDSTKTARSTLRSFKLSGGCPAAEPFVLTAPATGAVTSTDPTLAWSRSANAAAYDLYLGTSQPPPLLLSDLASTSFRVSGLAAGTIYYWRVVAKVGCDPTKSFSTPVANFMTQQPQCPQPQRPQITFAPPGAVAAGQTYTIGWNDVELVSGGVYEVQRASDSGFTSIVDSQRISATSASFTSSSTGTYYHRVRAIPACDSSKASAYSDGRSTSVVTGSPNVVFTVQPQAVVATLGEKLEEKFSNFAVENITSSPVSILLGRLEINSVPFFTIVDPAGGDSAFINLEPRKPKQLQIRYSGPPNDSSGSYHGVIFAASAGSGLAITPYAFVGLKVGSGEGAKPRVAVNNVATEYAAFAPFSGSSDAPRPPLTLTIQNPGSTPMEVGADIGPEAWLVPEAGWNTNAIPAGQSRQVRLFTKRDRAPNGSAFPRYTYVTFRTKSGERTRVLVQDNDLTASESGRTAALDRGVRSYIVPSVASDPQRQVATRIQVANVSTDSMQAELLFTPDGADGFDNTAVKRAVVVIPPNDVVTLTDPLAQVFGLTSGGGGQIEIRAAPEKISNLVVRSASGNPGNPTGEYGARVPALLRGEGASVEIPHVLPGITSNAITRTTVTLAETSGVDSIAARVTFFDADGVRRGERSVNIKRYGETVIDVRSVVGDTAFEAGRAEITIDQGGGTLAALARISDGQTESAATIVSQPRRGSGQAFAKPVTPTDGPSVSLVAPVVGTGPVSSASTQSYQTSLGLVAPSSATANFIVKFVDALHPDQNVQKTISVASGKAVEYTNVLSQLFQLTSNAQGSLFIDGPAGSTAYLRMVSTSGSSRVSLSTTVPLFPASSEALTSAGANGARPLYLDGLEQSTDRSSGSSWVLVLTEVSGQPATAMVRLYEAGNRSTPIAERDFPIAANGQLRLDTIWRSMGLDSDDRRKDRTNVQCVVVAKSGGGSVSAVGISIDNRTGNVMTFSFQPTGGTPESGSLTNPTRVLPIAPPTNPRRRAVKR